MRAIGLAIVALALALFATPASAAVIQFEKHFCGCDGSSGDEDTIGIVVRALPGEHNVMAVNRRVRGILITDSGAPLTGACRPARGGGRFCRGSYDTFDGVDVFLGDGLDLLEHSVGGSIEGGSGEDSVRITDGFFQFLGGPGADTLDATGALGGSVSYADHAEGVTVTLGGDFDDGAPGEGDTVTGHVTGITGGAGDDRLEAGPTATALLGGDGHDTLLGSPGRDTINAGEGNDELLGGDGDDHLTGGGGADILSGGNGLDEVIYTSNEPLRLSIGDGPNDGTEGERDDIRTDVEGLTGGGGDDVLIGDEDANRLIAYGGHDVLRAGGGADELIGWNDGDELDAGPGADSVESGARDRPLLADGERDRLNCHSRAPAIEADPFDELRSCAPQVTVRPARRLRAGRPLVLRARCPVDSTVPCAGRLWVHLRGGRRLSRTVRFGPIEPGGRDNVTVRLGSIPRRSTCLYATTRARRGDGFDTATVTRSVFACLPR